MARNPKFNSLLDEMRAIHERKNQDYASDQNPYSNFEFAGMIAAMFSDPVDISFAGLIGVKVARLAELRGKGKQPQNESIDDTMLDLAVYAALWASYVRGGKDGVQLPESAPVTADSSKRECHTQKASVATATPTIGGTVFGRLHT